MFNRSILRHLLSSCAFAAPVEGAGGSRPAKPKASVPTAGKSPFAHLARNAPKAAEDDKDEKDKDAAEDEGEEEHEEDDDKKTKKAKKAKKAKADDDGDSEDSDDDASEDDAEDDDKKAKKSKKAEDGDDESDRDDDADAKARAARARERGRIKAIVTSDAGVLNPVAAMELACGTPMSRKSAIGLLKAMGAGATSEPKKTDALRNRMSGVDTPDIGAGDGEKAAPNLAQQIIQAGKKRRGEV